MNKEVINFLELNGFIKSKTPKGNIILSNDLCTVYKSIDELYVVVNNNGEHLYIPDINIYWLIGYLTYNGYMNKNYKQLTTINNSKIYSITYQKSLDIVRDELEPFVNNDGLLYDEEPMHIYLTDDLGMSNIDKYELSNHLDKYLSSTINMIEIENWDTIDDVVKYVMKNFK